MALALDALSSSGEAASVSSKTWSHTCTGSNLILIVCINARGVKSNTNTTVSGVTYNGVALTKVTSHATVDGATGPDTYRGRTEIWYLVAPATGANNIVVTWSGTIDFGCCGAISLTGAIQSASAIDSHASQAANTDTTPSCAPTVVASDCYLIDSIYSRSTPPLTKDASQTLVFNTDVNGGGDSTGASYKVSPGTGAQTMAWTCGSEETTIVAVAIAPLVAAGTAVKDMVGVGILPFAR